MIKINNRFKTRLFPDIVLTMVITTIMIVVGMGMSISFQSTFALTEEQEELGTDKDGKKKSYTDCEGYEKFTENAKITKEDADYNTDYVDARILSLSNQIAVSDDKEKDRIEELECLQAIRAIEDDAEKGFLETANDLSTFAELQLQQMETNSKLQSLYDKYD